MNVEVKSQFSLPIDLIWFSTLFSFVLGTAVSNGVVVLSFIITMSTKKFYKVRGREWLIFLFLYFMILVVYLLFAITILQLTDSSAAINFFLYYARAVLIVYIISTVILDSEREFYESVLVCGVITSFIVLLSFIAESVGAENLSLRVLVPSSFLEREYSGYTGFFNNPNYWSIFAFLNVLILFSSCKNYTKDKLKYLIVVSSTLVAIASLIATGSRMAMILCILATVMIFRPTFLKGGVTLVILIVVGFIFASEIESLDFGTLIKTFERFDRLLNNFSNEDRFSRALIYYENITSNKYSLFFGIGLGTELYVGPPHNTFFLLMRDFGIFSIVAFCLMYSYLLYKLTNSRLESPHRQIVILSLISIPIFFLTNDIVDSRPFWFLFAIPIGYLFSNQRFTDAK
jgi:hypothetical protein